MSTPFSPYGKHWAKAYFWGLILLESSFLGGIRSLGDIPERFSAFILLFFFATFAYTLQIHRGLRGHWPTLSPITIILVGAGLRCIFVGSEPALSSDLYRYLFEGGVTLTGGNPFVTAPSVSTYGTLNPELLAQVNHPAIPTVYPPFAQLIFMGLAASGGGVIAAQLSAIAFDILTLTALIAILKTLGKAPSLALIYALHPLPALEFGQSAHMDSFAIAPLALGVLALLQGRRGLSAFAFGISAATKLIGGFGLLALAFGHGRIRPLIPLLGALILPLSYLFFYDPAIFSGLETYARHWRFNESIFAIIDALLPHALARPGTVILFGAIALYLAAKASTVDFILGTTAAFFFLSPTAHPWYFLWVLPWLTLRFSWGLALFGSALALSYHALTTLDPATGAWFPQPWVQWVEYGGLALLLLAEGWISLHKKNGDGALAEIVEGEGQET